MYYFASFDVSEVRHALGTVILATAGKSNAVVDITTLSASSYDASRTVTSFNHFQTDLGHVLGEDAAGTYFLGSDFPNESFALALQTALRAAATAQSWVTPSNITVSKSLTTHLYTIAYSASITVTYTGNAARLLGIVSGTSGTSLAGTRLPYFIINPTLDTVSAVGGATALNYEPEGISTASISAAGHSAGMARTVAPLFRDWVQQYEVIEKVMRASADVSHPYTFQALFEDCRCVMPFVVGSGGFGDSVARVFKLRPGSDSFKSEPASDAANHAQQHIAFNTLVIGVPS